MRSKRIMERIHDKYEGRVGALSVFEQPNKKVEIYTTADKVILSKSQIKNLIEFLLKVSK